MLGAVAAASLKDVQFFPCSALPCGGVSLTKLRATCFPYRVLAAALWLLAPTYSQRVPRGSPLTALDLPRLCELRDSLPLVLL